MSEITPRFTLPASPRQYKFVLTPLADAMFQLLIFFMLSSSLAPYALMTVRSGSPSDFANAPGTSTTGQASRSGTVAIWNVSEDGLTISGQPFGFDALPALAAAITDADATILLLIRDTATVQHLARVVEALTAASVTNVQIAEAPA